MEKPNIYIFPQLSDNYGYLIKKPHSKEAAIVDPSDFEMCEKILDLNECVLSHILLTHHHDDHIGAVKDLKQKYNSIVIGNEKDNQLPDLDLKVNEGDEINLFENHYQVISTPGHTLKHVCYYNINYPILFAGDTLFSIGCGRMFEGTPELFWNSLLKIKSLPPETLIYSGHEYTQSNLKFALSIDSNNGALIEYGKWVDKQYLEVRPTMPSKLENELNINPFLRCDSSDFHSKFQTKNAIEIFKKIREAKDTF